MGEIVYSIIGLILAIKLYRLGSFGIIFPIIIFFFWLPIAILLALTFAMFHICPDLISETILGWKVDFNNQSIPLKSIIVMAPHTSIWDAIIGKLILLNYCIDHKILSSAHLFVFPLKYFMEQGLEAIPIGGVKGKNAILEVKEYLSNHYTNIVICPEGQLAATDRWNPGFYYMAYKANVPIKLCSMDYEHKTVKFGPEIDPTQKSLKETFDIMREFYKDSNPKNPEKFKLPKN